MSEFDPVKPEVQPASLADFEALKNLLDAANAYGEAVSGKRPWKMVELAYEDIRDHLVKGEVYVIRDESGTITSTITLSDSHEDWGDAGHDGTALYFTKLMKNPDTAGPDDAKYLLEFAVGEAKARRKSALRCDTVADTPELVDYYLKLGFRDAGHFNYDSSERAGVLLELPVG